MSAYFGLDVAPEVTGIVIIWPVGDVESFDGGAADRYVRVERGRGERVPVGSSQ